MDKFLNQILTGDCIEIMKSMESDIIDLTVTSPPYDNMRSYKGIIKRNRTYDDHFSFPFVEMAEQLYRVTKPGGIVVWVVNDQIMNGGESGNSFRQALKFQDIGFKLYDTMIYHKNGPPFPETGRYSQVFEYMFVLLKGTKPNTVNLIRDRKNRWSGQSNFGKSSSRGNDDELKKGGSFVVSDYGSRYNVWYINNGYGYSTKDKYAFEHPACVDVDTECLTIEGWKKFNEINIGETIMSYNINDDSLEWDSIKNIYVSEYNGDIFDVQGRRVSMMLTPNHRNVIFDRGNIYIKETSDLKKRHDILTSCPNLKNNKFLDKNLSYIIGIILTDGYIKDNAFHITQDFKKNEEVFDKIVNSFDNLQIEYSVSKRKRYYSYIGEKNLDNLIRIKEEDKNNYDYYKVSYCVDIRILDKEVNKILFDLIPNKKITHNLFCFNKETISSILEGIIDGDGYNRESGTYVITGKDIQFHDNVQILSFLCGYTADIMGSNKIYTQLTIKRNKTLRNKKTSLINKKPFEGIVWCPETQKNGTWVARRNGKIFITGNSFPESLAEDHILSWSNPGDVVLDPMCGSGTSCKMAKMNSRNFIGIDMVDEYVEISKKRVEDVIPYTKEDPNPKSKFILSREEILSNRKKKKST